MFDGVVTFVSLTLLPNTLFHLATKLYASPNQR